LAGGYGNNFPAITLIKPLFIAAITTSPDEGINIF
jgi:hypothetical protein